MVGVVRVRRRNGRPASQACLVAAASAGAIVANRGIGGGIGSNGRADGRQGIRREGRPSRHLWLGNVPAESDKPEIERLFGRFGPLESVRVFPGKTFAFVNYLELQHAVAARMGLDGQCEPALSGEKRLIVRYQEELTLVSADSGRAGVNSRGSQAEDPLGFISAAFLVRVVHNDGYPPEPMLNLSNMLNPNNIYYNEELAARYVRMNAGQKAALWAHDVILRATVMEDVATAAAIINADTADGPGHPDTSVSAARLLALARRGNLAAVGPGGAAAGSGFWLPRARAADGPQYRALNSGEGGRDGRIAGGNGLFVVLPTQDALGFQQVANAASLLDLAGAAASVPLGLLEQYGLAPLAATATRPDDAAAVDLLEQQFIAVQQEALLQEHLMAVQQQAALQQEFVTLQQQQQQLMAVLAVAQQTPASLGLELGLVEAMAAIAPPPPQQQQDGLVPRRRELAI
ncbi:hypothetical protein VOLCADRAFT_95588 [Volvox carteri f. nagariensis]|uniref:RRM domain-containing protein n=1 Tax=Volvox carteri f. nagariensis TaxID=3068 RepID=D8U806_VOLCA|nr:uncharacterized protein VOLCADRAFT_95588 [Volvox carteri f. nagariensis]EFJ44183.1 hypothetical protein VOLCADRAFT_95588 [Volvox carteri f. nagariensis]|eukprot:XP_002954777.1 hypothetical protein VOLCADRAFT_95588 [Volvox carteri f. nagariensis]